MVRETVFLNSRNWVKNTNRFTMKFQQPRLFTKGSKVSLLSLVMYNQSFNIAAKYGNNTFSIKWINNVTYNFTIPDGYYSVEDLDSYIQYVCLINLLYVNVTGNTAPTYFINLKANVVQYKGQINLIAVPTSTQASTLKYTKPSDATWNWPSVATTPQFILSEGLGKLLGFSSSNLTLPSTPLNVTTSFFSDITPDINPVEIYVFCCNLLNSASSFYPDIIAQLALAGSDIGSQVEYKSSMLTQLDIQEGTYSEVTISIYDQDMNPLEIRDPECGIQLVLDY